MRQNRRRESDSSDSFGHSQGAEILAPRLESSHDKHSMDKRNSSKKTIRGGISLIYASIYPNLSPESYMT
jgi:hypothetical protein